MHPGVYVPRWQSLELARRAADRLPDDDGRAGRAGRAIDLCTGSGAIAVALSAARPHACVVATDLDPRAVSCARANGVEAHQGDLFEPVPAAFGGATDVVVSVVPYVPTPAAPPSPRHVDLRGCVPLRRRPGGPRPSAPGRRRGATFPPPAGALLLELGGEQADALTGALVQAGFGSVTTWHDEDGDLRGLEATLG